MKKIIKCVCLITGLWLSAISLSNAGQFDTFTIFYINGVNNTPRSADETTAQLSKLAIPDAPNVYKLYQKNGTVLSQILQAHEQNFTDGSRNTYKNLGKWLSHLNLAPQAFMNNVYWPTLAKFDENTYTNSDPHLTTMIDRVKSTLQNGAKVILVSHSQGNFYANAIANYIQTNTTYGKCIGVVAVATPATNVATNGPWTTLANDWVINTARATFVWGPSILSPNPSSPISTADPLNHNMVTAYLNTLSPQIRQQIINEATAVNSSCPSSTVPVRVWYNPTQSPCGYSALNFDSSWYSWQDPSGIVQLTRGNHSFNVPVLSVCSFPAPVGSGCSTDEIWRFSYVDRNGNTQTFSLDGSCAVYNNPHPLISIN